MDQPILVLITETLSESESFVVNRVNQNYSSTGYFVSNISMIYIIALIPFTDVSLFSLL